MTLMNQKDITMKALTLRGIDGELEQMLKSESENSGTSMNATIIKILREMFGLTEKKYRAEYHDLDHLAGTWTKDNQIEFEKNTLSFSKIDKDMWQ